jgi:hypothetical protein
VAAVVAGAGQPGGNALGTAKGSARSAWGFTSTVSKEGAPAAPGPAAATARELSSSNHCAASTDKELPVDDDDDDDDDGTAPVAVLRPSAGRKA